MQPIWDTAIIIDTDVNADINTDLPENSAPMMTTDSRLLKCNTQLYPPGLLSARPILDPAIAIDTDVSADIYADLPENSAPMMNTDSRLLKCNMQVYPPGRDTQGCRPMKGITKPLQVELSGLTLAIDRTNEEQMPPSISWKQSDPIITEGQDYWESTEGAQFSYDTGYSSSEFEVAIRREVLRNRSMKYMSSHEVDGHLLLPEHANMSDTEISLDQVHSEGLRQWNMDMDIEYQCETFNGLPVYYGGVMYDSEDTEGFYPDVPAAMGGMTYAERPPDDGDGRSVNAVNMAPVDRTVSRVARCEVDKSSDMSGTDTARLEEVKLCNSSYNMSSYEDVAYMGDFVDEDFMETGFDSDIGSEAQFRWTTRDDACTWESWRVSGNSPPDSAGAQLARVNVPDLSREGPFDIHQGHQHSGASPRLRQDNQGCPF